MRGTVGNIGLSASSESIYQTKYTRSRGSSTRHHPHRVSTRRNKENGSSGFFKNGKTSNSTKKLKIGNENLSICSNSDNITTLMVNHTHPGEANEHVQSNTKSRIVSFGETPIIVKMSNKSSVYHIPFGEQRDQAL